MKMHFNFFLSVLFLTACILFMTGCAKTSAGPEADTEAGPAAGSEANTEANTEADPLPVMVPVAEERGTPAAGDVPGDTDTVSDNPSETEGAEPSAESSMPEESLSGSGPVKADFKPHFSAVTWLGDSLTQGSLGDDNHNENNPHAPWRVLAEVSGWDVEGYGYYGYYTGEIFWKFGEDDGIRDPGRLYVFWVGSNDFRDSPDNITTVTGEIDKFLAKGGLDKYLVLGTTNRGDMDPTAHVEINRRFEEKYKDRYLDIIPYVQYGPDGIHLTEDSYRAIGEAVYLKITGS